MALAINQQFTRFVEFASGDNAHGMDSIARAGGIAQGGILAGRAIKEAEGDSIGKIRRSDDLQRENDMARKLFRQSVVEIFGGEAKIPKSVKDAMKLKDYDQGKPLTARRILAVKAAIDVYAARAAEALDRAKEVARGRLFYGDENHPISPEERARIDRVLTVAVNAAVTDPDALEVVVACGKDIVETGDRNLRTEDAIKDRVAKLLANVAELRTVAKGNERVFAAGLAFLKAMRGKPVADGTIRALVETTMKQNIGALKSLNANSSGIKLHKAVVQVYNNLTKAMEKADSIHVTGNEGDVKVRFRNFCVQLMLVRIGDEALPTLKTLLEQKGSALNSWYGDIAGRFEFDNMDPELREYMIRPARNCGDTIEKLYWQLQILQGTPQNGLQPIPYVRNANYLWPDRPNYVDIDAMDVASGIRDRAEEYAQQDRDLYLKSRVLGNGRGANKVRAVFDKAFPPMMNGPNNQFKMRMDNNVRGIINHGLCRTCKGVGLNGYQDANFQYDLAHGRINVTLPGGVALDQGPEDAYNKLAAFITNGAKHTAAELDERETKKLLTLIALLGQSCCEASEKGATLALDPRERDGGKLATTSENARSQLTLSFDSRNRLVVRCKREYGLTGLRVKNDQGAMENVAIKAGSKVASGHVIKIPVAEFDRFAGLDFAAYDDAPVQQRLDDPDVEKPYHNIRQTLGNGFGFSNEVIVEASYTITVN